MITIHLDPLDGLFIEEKENGRSVRKYINFEDLEEIFKRNVNLDTGILPKDCIYYSRENGNTIVVMQREPQKTEISYHKRGTSEVQKYTVPTPYSIFGFLVRERRVVESFLVASQMPILEMTTEVYRFPFGNVFNDFRICWGRTTLPTIRSPRFLAGLPNLFYAAPFNGDLSENIFRDYHYERYNLEHFFNELNGREFFPYNKMLPAGTFGDFLYVIRRSAR